MPRTATPPVAIPVRIRGEVFRSYHVDTIDVIDRNLRGLVAWLRTRIARTPELAGAYWLRYAADANALLDVRLARMRSTQMYSAR